MEMCRYGRDNPNLNVSCVLTTPQRLELDLLPERGPGMPAGQGMLWGRLL